MATKVTGRPKIAVSERALIQRINRQLRKKGEELRSARNSRQAEELGDYYTIHTGTPGEPQKAVSQGVCIVHVNLEKYARELGVLQPWEELEKK